ncbi:MAG: radical SAM protein [Theionarchaea archaeon]|nr:radical SAM protein [Theionarchaea archaeon]
MARTSSHNVVIPLSSEITASEDPLYLICNPLSGKVAILEEKEYSTLASFPCGTPSTLSLLKEYGFITSLTELEEKELLMEKYNAQKASGEPTASISVTYQCNMRCTYCWTDHLLSRGAKWMNAVIDEKTVNAAFHAIENIPELEGVTLLSLYGGEPFLPSTLSIVQYILDHGDKKDYTFHANTNGYFLEQFVPLLSSHEVTGLGVTLDGCKEVHDQRRRKKDGSGTFDNIVRGIEEALDAGIRIGVRVNVDEDNLSHLPKFAEWITSHGWAHRDNITFSIALVLEGKGMSSPSFLSYTEMARRILDLREKEPRVFEVMLYEWTYMKKGFLSHALTTGEDIVPRPFYCSAHCKGFGFDLFGDIYSCPRAVGDTEFSIGRFVPQLEFNEKYHQWFNRDVLSIPECRECELALLCGGGCAYRAYLEHGDIYRADCDNYKAFVSYGVPFFVRKILELQK